MSEERDAVSDECEVDEPFVTSMEQTDMVEYCVGPTGAGVTRVEGAHPAIFVRSLVFHECVAKSVPVTIFYDYAFSGQEVESVYVPRSVEEIACNCFYDTWSLKWISFESECKLASIGSSAFAMSGLRSIVIPRSVSSIQRRCFLDAVDLTSVEFEPNSQITQLGDEAFLNTGIAAFEVPRSAESIGKSCFASSARLESISFEPGAKLSRIESCAFVGTSLKTITLPQSLSQVSGDAFPHGIVISIEECNGTFDIDGSNLLCANGSRLVRHCGSLPVVLISCKITCIAEGAFFMSQAADVAFELGSRAREFAARAFACAMSLRSIVIPRSVVAIGAHCFEQCRCLDSVVIESCSLLTAIGDAAFHLCPSLKTIAIPEKVEYIARSCFCNCTALRSVTFDGESELKRIGAEAFFACQNLASIVIPRNVSIIGPSALVHTTSVSVEQGNEYFKCHANLLIRCHTEIVRAYGSPTSVVIPKEIEVIGPSSFEYCQSLALISFEEPSALRRIELRAFQYAKFPSIVIPRTVEFLEGGAFSYAQIPEIQFQEGIPLTTIGCEAFRENVELVEIVIPRNVREILSGCFTHCTKLERVEFESRSVLKKIHDLAFWFTFISAILLPPTISFIHCHAFRPECEIKIDRPDVDAEFEAWNQQRKSSQAATFVRRESEN